MRDIHGQNDDLIVTNAGPLVDSVVHTATTNSTFTGLIREAIKDGRNAIMEFFFGKGERGGEPGTPLNPLFHDIVAARESYGAAHEAAPSITASILANPQGFLASPQGPEHAPAQGQDQGHQPGIGPGRSITETILSNPQSFLPPEPQQQNDQEHQNQQQYDHGRGM